MASRKQKRALKQAEAAAQAANAAAHEKLDQVLRVAHQAKTGVANAYNEQLAPAVQKVVSRVQPTIEGAYESVAEKVQTDVAPRVQDAWEKAQKNPQVRTVANRGASAVAALRGDLSLPEAQLPIHEIKQKKPRWGRRIALTVFLLAAAAGIVAFLRSLFSTDEEGWTPQEPNRVPKDTNLAWGDSPLKADPDVDTSNIDSEEEAEAVMTEEGAPDQPTDYGEGSYVGDNPPEGYTIKGNERSMKYHVNGTGGFERTIADVWFNSEEAAEKAGFTKAQR